MTIAMEFRTLDKLLLLVFLFSPSLLLCSARESSKGHKSDDKGWEKDDYSRFTAPQLTKADKRHLARLEDALTSKKGKLIFTNSWAVQLNPEQVASADEIAKRNGFHNMGQVSLQNYTPGVIVALTSLRFAIR